jgi:hypothetical protein
MKNYDTLLHIQYTRSSSRRQQPKAVVLQAWMRGWYWFEEESSSTKIREKAVNYGGRKRAVGFVLFAEGNQNRRSGLPSVRRDARGDGRISSKRR